MLVELRPGVYIDADKVETVFFDPPSGFIVIQLPNGKHTFKLLEGEDPMEVTAKFVDMINRAQNPYQVTIENSITAQD